VAYSVYELDGQKHINSLSFKSFFDDYQFYSTDSLANGYMDSDSVMSVIDSFFINIHTISDIQYIELVLGVSKYTFGYMTESGQTYWCMRTDFAQFNGSSKCYIHAIKGTCECNFTTDVLDKTIIKTNLNLCPNPAEDILNVQIPSDIAYQDATLRITNLNCNIIKDIRIPYILSSQIYTIDVSKLINGQYNITFYNNNTYYSSQFMIAR
jgi:hypothetical protein